VVNLAYREPNRMKMKDECYETYGAKVKLKATKRSERWSGGTREESF